MATEPGKQGMGTTMVAVLITGGEFRVANVGDSRAYLVTADGIRQLTDDHSFVAEAMKRGQSKAEAMATPWRDALTRSIGTEPDVDVDVFGPFPMQGNSAFLICSDGLYKTLAEDDLRDLFMQSGGTRGAAQAMVTAAFDGGSDDNISVVIAEYGDVPRDKGPTTMVLSFEAEAAALTAPEKTQPLPVVEAAPAVGPAAVDEAAVVGGLPMFALAAVAVVVAALVAILVFSG
jgi:serine/threonine protein phosphatase PrpC